MDLLAQVADGFRSVEAAPALKEQALNYLRQWLAEPEFAAYLPAAARMAHLPAMGRPAAGIEPPRRNGDEA